MGKIKTVYVIHHSHTDIGYTDLQERVTQMQVDYIRSALKIMRNEENAAFRWNCETLFCVEEFFKTASEEEKRKFISLAKEGKIGLSANYLNFTDLADTKVFFDRLSEWQKIFDMKTAMMADINGISMGYRDAMLNAGVEFLFMNIHCHHGMYPLRQNQTAFYWRAKSGKRLLVWNGEHYNLGNVLGIKPNRTGGYMAQNYFGTTDVGNDKVSELNKNLSEYLTLCEDEGYKYDFIITSVSGVFSDNAPPEPEILRTIEAYNRLQSETELKMVSLQELYALIAPKLKDAPEYSGDLTDWWANGVGSTPYAVKHYREAQKRYALCGRLDKDFKLKYPALAREAEDNLLLYAEHTWGHSSTVSNPCDTMVTNLDIRKTSYASKAHEAASRIYTRILREKGDLLRYYSENGYVRFISANKTGGRQLCEFYVESPYMNAVKIADAGGREIISQVSPHPRGRLISFTDEFKPGEEKTYSYAELPLKSEPLNSRKCYVGSERVRDIVNDYDPVSYRLPWTLENKFFRLEYEVGEGVKSLYDKVNDTELTLEGEAPIFTPMYELTPTESFGESPQGAECEKRRLLGRNIRGADARLYKGRLENAQIIERGSVFTQIKLMFSLPGTVKADVIIKMYEELPRIDFTLKIGKTLSGDIESVFMPLTLSYKNRETVLIKGGSEAFLPGVEQIPGTGMEYYISDGGVAYTHDKGTALLLALDAPLIYFGEMKAHPIRLCENDLKDNLRPAYSWIMNNCWETNFKMDLSGFGEFNYSLRLAGKMTKDEAADALTEEGFDACGFIVG